MTDFEGLLGKFENVRRTHRGAMAICPAHADENRSLSIGIGRGGRFLVHCFAGCDVAAILRSRGLTWANLFPRRP